MLRLRIFSCFFILGAREGEELEGLIEDLLPGFALEVEGVARGSLDLLQTELQIRQLLSYSVCGPSALSNLNFGAIIFLFR